MSYSMLEALGIALVDWQQHDVEDCIIAIQAANSMAKKIKHDVAIMSDLSTKPYKKNMAGVLEVIRYDAK